MKKIHFVSADEAVQVVKSHDRIHLSSVASVPHVLIEALVRRADAGEIKDVRFHHFHTEGPAPYSAPEYSGIFFDQGFFLGPNVRKNVNAGYADYLPVHLGESQKLYRSGALKCNVAMVQVSLPDENGYVSLGTSVDCSIAAIESADHVIAVVNKNVPYAFGEEQLSLYAGYMSTLGNRPDLFPSSSYLAITGNYTYYGVPPEALEDDVFAAMLEEDPSLKALAAPDNGTMTVFYFESGTATIYSFTEAPKVIAL